uniref:Lipase n=1 Tax=Musca domestica TaxID=7370 RepID=A0A1I8N8D1_MUSDO
MRTCVWLALLISLTAVGCQPTPDILRYFQNPEPQLTLRPKITTADRIASHGYPAETHKVVTEDGYIITLFRIPYSHKLQNQNAYRPIVLIQHGLFSSSDGWMLNGPNDGIGFNLADAGYDVWFGNARGNTYSRNHTSMSTNHPYFWRFSWHEIGHYDIAAMIDYALAINGQGQKAIHYVGHSQGTTVFFALMSSRPEYNAKIKTAHMLAPVAFMSNMSDKLVRTLAPYLGHHNGYAAFFNDQEFIPYNELFTKLGYNACAPNSKTHQLCNSIAYMLEGPESNTNRTGLVILAETHPAGCSTNQICHYMQEQQSGRFCLYDYGRTKNLQLYGQPTPPDYPVEQITSKVHLWYSDNDDMAAVVDVERLADKLPNRVMHHMEDPTWAHGDFASHIEVKKYINEPIIEIMNDYEQEMKM